MTWTKKSNVAQYKKATNQWATNYVATVPDCTVAKAKRIAMANPEITSFFFAREYMILEGFVYDNYGAFNPGDAVFFKGSLENDWYGSAPQCDSYEKGLTTVAYYGMNGESVTDFLTVGDYTMADGSPAIDIVIMFAANMNLMSTVNAPNSGLTLLSDIDNNPTTPGQYDNYFMVAGNSSAYPIISANQINQLQDKGITVLLSILGNHDAAGWSNFQDNDIATNYVSQIKNIVDTYGFDGIDIDDEYSDPLGLYQNSLAMITYKMKAAIDVKLGKLANFKVNSKIISKALWDDINFYTTINKKSVDLQYFKGTYEGTTLADNLTYGWYMGYPSSASTLSDYTATGVGMNRNALLMGYFRSQDGKNNSPADISSSLDVIQNTPYAGAMVYNFQTDDGVNLMGQINEQFFGSGNWNKTSS